MNAVPACALSLQAEPRRPILSDRQCDELYCIGRLHAHQHVMLTLRLRLRHSSANAAGVADGLASDIEDHVAGL